MNAKEYKARRLTDIEAILILSKNDNIFQTAKRINDFFEAKSKEEAEESITDLQKKFLLKFTTWRTDEYEDTAMMNERTRPLEIFEWFLAAFGKEGEG